VDLLRIRTLATGLALVAVTLGPLQAFAQEVTIGGPFEGEARSLNAAGGTFPAPLYQKWFDQIAAARGGPIFHIPTALNNLGFGVVQNSSGEWIQPSLADAYPISTATWILTYREIPDRARALAITRMLWWAAHDAQQVNNGLAYATVPPELVTRSEEFIRQITSQGKAIFPGR
jgi:ABC-type phosphate transport system substrate-binding protein